MGREPQNLGRAYLVSKLGEHGLSRRNAVRVLGVIFEAMSQAVARGELVEFPLGRLVGLKRLSRRWELVEDEPMKPYTVEHELDAAGYKLLPGKTDPAVLAFLVSQDRLSRPHKSRSSGK